MSLPGFAEDLGEHLALLELSTPGSLMDSAHLVRLCFLLLTIAAPHPSESPCLISLLFTAC